MRTTLALLLLALAVTALADKSQFKNKLTTLLNMQARASDAIDTALQLLRDLKQANVDAQAAADEQNRTQEEQLGKQIADLLYIADTNKASGNDATAYRKHVENEIQVTQEYLVWINNRRDEIYARRSELIEQRCYASLAFVKSLKELDEARQAIVWTKEDVLGIVEGGADLSQIKSSSKKLTKYAHLFNEAAMKEFLQLTQGAQPVDPATGEWNSQATDNTQDALSFDTMGAGTEGRNVGQTILSKLDEAYQFVLDTIEKMKRTEIDSAWSLVAYLNDSERELAFLDDEQAAKTTYIDKMLIAIIGAKAHEDTAWEIYFESAATYNNAVADLADRRDSYEEEKARRDEENGILDDVIKMFIQGVTNLNSGMRNKLETGEDLQRQTDAAYARDFGRVAGNVASEAALL